MQAELEQWLLSLPLAEPCHANGEIVYLRLGEGGAELGLVLAEHPTPAQIADAMRAAFQGALAFHAGLGLAPASGALVLNQWLPGVRAWSEAGAQLEDLLNQAALWRCAMEGGATDAGAGTRRDEARMRRMLHGG